MGPFCIVWRMERRESERGVLLALGIWKFCYGGFMVLKESVISLVLGIGEE